MALVVIKGSSKSQVQNSYTPILVQMLKKLLTLVFSKINKKSLTSHRLIFKGWNLNTLISMSYKLKL